MQRPSSRPKRGREPGGETKGKTIATGGAPNQRDPAATNTRYKECSRESGGRRSKDSREGEKRIEKSRIEASGVAGKDRRKKENDEKTVVPPTGVLC